jgi:hypothetical protein
MAKLQMSMCAGIGAMAVAALAGQAQALTNLAFTYYAYGGVYQGPDSFASGGGGNFIGDFNYTENSSQIVITYQQTETWSSSSVSLNSNGLYITNGALFDNPNINISNVTIDPSSVNLGAFSASNITFNAHDVALDWQNQTFQANSVLVLDLKATPSVPEPASWALLLAGFVGLGATMRGRRQLADA